MGTKVSRKGGVTYGQWARDIAAVV